ncbi:Ephrin-4 [Dirofilaria immitis]|nr:Ephrin-4 [Dirofilaria immitis]
MLIRRRRRRDRELISAKCSQKNKLITYERFTNHSLFQQDAEIGVGAAFIEVDTMDSMEIVCPTYRIYDNIDKPEQLIIYQVSDLSFMSCELDSRSQAFLICDSPLATIPISHKIVFRQISPLPNGFEYQPGRSYYLITTSNGSMEGMNNTRLGLCVTANMRLRIDVRPLSDHSYPSSEEVIGNGENSKEGWSRNRRINTPMVDNVKTEQDMDRLNNESQKFAKKHGLDLTRLEYVRQLAIDGIEGDFSFQKLENDSLASMASSETILPSGPEQPRFSSTLPDNEEFYSTSMQAQQWFSKEIQSKNTSGVELANDYVVDDVSGADSIFVGLEAKYAIVNALLLLWNSGRRHGF